MALSTMQHNETVLSRLKPGDLVEFKRDIYSHWGVYVGNGDIVHLAGEDGDGLGDNVGSGSFFSISGARFNKAKVCKEKFWKVVENCKAYIGNDKDKEWGHLSPSEIVKRALEKLGETGYNLISQNCEHFARWCRYDKAVSVQVDNVMTGVAVGVAGLIAIGVVGAFVSKNKSKENQKHK